MPFKLGKKQKLKHRKHNSGSVFIEATIVLPVMILIVFGSYEFYKYYITYMTMSHTAREVAIIGSTVTNIAGSESNLFTSVTKSDYDNCIATPTNSGCGQKVVQWMAKKLLDSQPVFYALNTLNVYTAFDSGSKIFTVKISSSFRSEFPILNNYNLVVQERSYHLGTN